MVIRFISILFLALAFLPSPGGAADQVSASLDRSHIQEGETVHLTLNIKGTGGRTPAPDLGPLHKDFDVLGTSQSSQISIINGRREDSLKFQVILRPKEVGDLLVPSLAVGAAKTRPLALKVTALKPGAPAQGQTERGDFFVEAAVESQTPYVGQPVVYAVRIFQGAQVRQENLSPPTLEGGTVEQLGDATAYQKERNGRSYRVVEVRYLLIPDQPGMTVIPGPVFRGGIPQQRRSRFGEGFFDSPLMDRMITTLVPVSAKGNEVRLDVKPLPQGIAGAWLPAQSVEVFEAFTPDPPSFRVGEPVTRTLTLRAKGVKAEQIPDLPGDVPEGINRFADKPVLETRLEAGLPVGVRLEKQALVPKRAGTMTLPAIRVPWWDVTTNTPQEAVLPSREVMVLPAAGETVPTAPRLEEPAPVIAPEAVSEPGTTATPDSAAGSVSPPGFAWWPQLAGLFLLGWLATLGLWWRERRGSGKKNAMTSPALDEAAWRGKLETACRRGDAAGAKAALTGWSRSRWGSGASHSLPGLAGRLNDAGAQEALTDLDRRLYAPDPGEGWSGPDFLARIESALKPLPAETGPGGEGLPDLYPSSRKGASSQKAL